MPWRHPLRTTESFKPSGINVWLIYQSLLTRLKRCPVNRYTSNNGCVVCKASHHAYHQVHGRNLWWKSDAQVRRNHKDIWRKIMTKVSEGATVSFLLPDSEDLNGMQKIRKVAYTGSMLVRPWNSIYRMLRRVPYLQGKSVIITLQLPFVERTCPPPNFAYHCKGYI